MRNRCAFGGRRWAGVILPALVLWFAMDAQVVQAAAFSGSSWPAVLADGGEGQVVRISYFSKFFKTETAIGTAVIWFLMVNSTVLLAMVIQATMRVRAARAMPVQFVRQVEALMKAHQYHEAMAAANQSGSFVGQVLSHALKQAHRGYEAIEEATYEAAENIGNEMIRKLVWMEVAGAAGPMLGLFGTVYGMIVAFTTMAAQGGQPKAAELSSGISTALVCTFWGLVVGIPGVISAAVLRVKVESVTAQVIWTVLELVEDLNVKPAGGAAGGAKVMSDVAAK